MDVVRAVWRVLRDDGTLWLVLGDSYNSGTQFNHHKNGLGHGVRYHESPDGQAWSGHRALLRALPPKSLLGIPWRVAFALQDDGWILRQELIWAKPNPMPESVKDRCTRGHETVFMMAKGPRYYYDQDAIRESLSATASYGGTYHRAGKASATGNGHSGLSAPGTTKLPNAHGRNRRSVWTVATSPLSSKRYGVDTEHYAAFPPELVRPMVRAGCPPDGTVLDPFCGSGSTGFVAVQEGRRFLGCDINADYVRLARARIATAQRPLPLDLVADVLAR